jgi:hypothetical protein
LNFAEIFRSFHGSLVQVYRKYTIYNLGSEVKSNV